MSALLRRRYGATPLHVLGHLASFALAAWALAHLLQSGRIVNLVAWLLGAILLHDLLFLPFYSLLDRVAHAGTRHAGAQAPAAVNFVRVPAVLSGLLALVYLPSILGRNDGNQRTFTGEDVTGYARNWLALTAALRIASALAYAVTRRRSRSRR